MSGEVIMQELDLPTQKRLTDLLEGDWTFARFGDIGCVMPVSYKDDANNFKNMAIRSDDVWVATFPRSDCQDVAVDGYVWVDIRTDRFLCRHEKGTTWSQELVWLVANDFDYDTALKIPLMGRYMFLEVNHLIGPIKLDQKQEDIAVLEELAKTMPSYKAIANAPSPRFMKTHMPFSLLPSNLLDTAKVVYVARDPRDVAVSWYHHNKLFYSYSGDFKSFWNLFINDSVIYAPFFPHLKEAWALRHHKNMLFIFYEDMILDLASSVKRIGSFLGKNITNEQVDKLCDHLDIKNFRNNESVNMSWILQIGNPNAEAFIRKGKSGGWRDHVDEEMTAQAQSWMRENLAGSDLPFPDASST